MKISLSGDDIIITGPRAGAVKNLILKKADEQADLLKFIPPHWEEPHKMVSQMNMFLTFEVSSGSQEYKNIHDLFFDA